MEPIAVIDFETTGMSPGQNCRATEIAAVIVQDGQITARYQSLMNSGAWVPPFIENLTGISNQMLRSAPSSTQVMREVADFVGGIPLVAHNAAFDQKFWDSELALIQRRRSQRFACSMLLARRLLPQAPNHKLGTLNSWAGLPDTGKAHRALADAEMAANLTIYLGRLLREQHGINALSHDFLCDLQKVPAAKIMQALSAAQGGRKSPAG
ncbi:3'-5' exonuclease [Pseudomonas sp. N040]|uniref:3'-5' exonuclease n=1 Tax=Pseudomonas sp. N040 TaxID=2785325 RepID=UPI0018A322BE|nr:3'-5' exonuclease [Pseudomonas sp. N040]MBF7730748.1 3'-5' exonuclease [Pseudomonas sp. N040]MBW7014391.1 3'-5' exonuclease [Pseudomonas sp. N040]